ncbi:hypothetical protein HF847_11330 [Clostridium cochlearium]|uniref:hypothetical protein n=1 Tax=Clostridium cochlearium TaxID=1494 RepID=UPI001459800D|nr:hypothetical protein [Clostridium cochlearium]NME96564.1 hypothetical protein [Clostridium cochlearium]
MSDEICITKEKHIVQQISKKISNYLDIKDSVLKNDYIEFLCDFSKVIGFFQKSTKVLLQKKFEAFLTGFRNNENPTEEQLEKLSNYINNEEKAEFIADTLSKILLSKSRKSCLIMGYIMQKIVDNKRTLSHYDLIYIDSLTNFFDNDILNFKFFCKYLLTETRSQRLFIYNNKLFKEECLKSNIDNYSMMLTIEKCVSCQLLIKKNEINLDIDEDDVILSSVENDNYYIISNPGKILYKYINELNL